MKLLFVASAAGIAAEVIQVGLHASPGLLAFKLDRANPVSGSKRIFQNVRNVWLLVLKLTAVFSALSWFFYSLLKLVDGLLLLPISVSRSYLFGLVFKLAVLLGGISAALALIDYFVIKRRWFKEVGMSLEDIRRENKEEEGDPMFKSLRRQQHKELMHQDLIKRIRAARVVIVERAN